MVFGNETKIDAVHDLKKLDQQTLLDMLATYTATFTKTYTQNGKSDELERLGETIERLQTEISFRRWNEERLSRHNDHSPGSPESI